MMQRRQRFARVSKRSPGRIRDDLSAEPWHFRHSRASRTSLKSLFDQHFNAGSNGTRTRYGSKNRSLPQLPPTWPHRGAEVALDRQRGESHLAAVIRVSTRTYNRDRTRPWVLEV